MESAITVGDIAAAAHLSPFHFSRRFKRATGLTPHRYLIDLRVNAARSLLLNGRYRSLAEIAGAVGFADQSHLARHFKRAFGVTPGRMSRGWTAGDRLREGPVGASFEPLATAPQIPLLARNGAAHHGDDRRDQNRR